ncbi:MAG: GSCFA domain-containing protein [Azoarcus sp.]|jgi:hypothetical protein|nr:GSCFA domain-containing protein [Azoarcus sp.]
MFKPLSPYQGLAAKAYWRPAVAERHYYDLEDLSRPVNITLKDKIATAGSCFAQHIGRHLQRSGAHYLDFEPRPDFIPADEAKRWGYETYSCRYGNIYTTRQLLQLAQEALTGRNPVDVAWLKDGRYFDALRPSVDPVGYENPDDILRLRRAHLKAVAEMFSSLDVFVFTLGLTEVWESRMDGTAYPTAAGTIIGEHDPAKYQFRNLRYPEIYGDLKAFIELLRTVNPGARVLLTVSPVPLNATASPDHVMVASCRSKSVLRAAAADIVDDISEVFYFPSYEIIASHPGRGMFFEPDLRNVNEAGVNLVMKHFFKAINSGAVVTDSSADEDEVICDEDALDKFSEAN